MILLSFHFDITVNDITVNLYSCCCCIIKTLRDIKLYICHKFHIQQRCFICKQMIPLYITPHLPPAQGCNKNKGPPHFIPPYGINNKRKLTEILKSMARLFVKTPCYIYCSEYSGFSEQ